jgi:hypothetical protein
MIRHSYKAALLASLSWVLVAPGVAEAKNNGTHGVQLPDGSQEVGENRFRSPHEYADTLKYFNTVYHGYPHKPIANQPGVKAVHIESIEPHSAWEGFNVYELNKEVRIFIIPREKDEGSKQEKRHGK